MMLSAPTRKSVTDLSRRKSRAFFAVVTLALAVAGIGLFALPELMNRSMNATVASDRLPDLTVYTQPLVSDHAQLAELAAIPNVIAVEPRAVFAGRVYVGARRAFAQVRGVADFGRQSADVVHVTSGLAPRDGQVLIDVQDAKHGLLDAHVGQTLKIISSTGRVRAMRVAGFARNLNGAQSVASDGVIVLYATAGTVASLSGVPGYEQLGFRLSDTSPAAVGRTVAAVRAHLAAVPGFNGFTDLPATRATGDWPGKSSFTQFKKFFYVITMLAFLAALVLIANTMTTLVSEQTPEIGVMKAIGARRSQVAGIYLTTALMLGALATVIGLVLGVVLSNVLARYLGSTFFAVTPSFGVDWRILLVSAAVGLAAPPLVALRAIRRAVRVPLREALEGSGSATGDEDAADRAVRHVGILPRTAQIGLRSVVRRRRRSAATVLVMSLAVGSLLAIMGLASSAATQSEVSWADHGESLKITSQGHPMLDAAAARVIRGTPGVASIEPMVVTDTKLAGKDAKVWGVRPQTMFHYRIASGRWYTSSEEQAHARVAVVERDLAARTDTHIGDTVTIQTAAGPVAVRVIGIATNTHENGTALFMPLATVHAFMTGMPVDANDYWVRTASASHAVIDRTATRIENALASRGYTVDAEIKYVKLANEVANNRTITTTLAVVGFLIVAISMAGLASALTTSVIERTREAGILRTIGARARDVRRIFATETIVLATTGWLIAIPVGYLLDRFLIWMVKTVVHITLPFTFPAGNVALALVGTLALALIITLAPIRRAVRYRPGDALRYA